MKFNTFKQSLDTYTELFVEGGEFTDATEEEVGTFQCKAARIGSVGQVLLQTTRQMKPKETFVNNIRDRNGLIKFPDFNGKVKGTKYQVTNVTTVTDPMGSFIGYEYTLTELN